MLPSFDCGKNLRLSRRAVSRRGKPAQDDQRCFHCHLRKLRHNHQCLVLRCTSRGVLFVNSRHVYPLPCDGNIYIRVQTTVAVLCSYERILQRAIFFKSIKAALGLYFGSKVYRFYRLFNFTGWANLFRVVSTVFTLHIVHCNWIKLICVCEWSVVLVSYFQLETSQLETSFLLLFTGLCWMLERKLSWNMHAQKAFLDDCIGPERNNPCPVDHIAPCVLFASRVSFRNWHAPLIWDIPASSIVPKWSVILSKVAIGCPICENPICF